MNKIKKDVEKALNELKFENPLVYCITNYVTVNDCANVLLAIGAAPIMADDPEEVEEIVSISNALVLNIGTLNKRTVESTIKAAKKANKIKIPIVFDPVGVGASNLRNEACDEIIKNSDITVIKGNMSEIKALSGQLIGSKGVEANENDLIVENNLKDNMKLVLNLSKEMKTCIFASGPIDIISDGKRVFYTKNGHEMMSQVSGTGCMLSAILGGYSAISSPLTASIAALAKFEVSSEIAAKKADGIGTFKTKIYDELYNTKTEDIINSLNLYE